MGRYCAMTTKITVKCTKRNDILSYRKQSLKEIVQSNQMSNMPHASSMMPVSIPDPAFVKRKVFLAQDAGDDHDRVLVN
jgi:hypothetical protein